MTYRTYTYLAADWDYDLEVINKLRSWNDSDYWSLSFKDAHDITQSDDGTLNCNIKKSLGERMNVSKTFVLVVGEKTKYLRAGSCYYCDDYNYTNGSCARGHSVSSKSFIEYECDKAVKDELRIVVIYNSSFVSKSRCPDAVKDKGTHVAAYHWGSSGKEWNYSEIKKAIMG